MQLLYTNLMTNNLRIFSTVSYLPLFALQGAKLVSVAFSTAQIKEEDAYQPCWQVLSRSSRLVTHGSNLRHSLPECLHHQFVATEGSPEAV